MEVTQMEHVGLLNHAKKGTESQPQWKHPKATSLMITDVSMLKI